LKVHSDPQVRELAQQVIAAAKEFEE